MDEYNSKIEQRTLVMQVIAGALLSGVLMFAVVIIFVLGALREPSSGEIVSLIGAGAALVMLVVHSVLPSAMATAAIPSDTAADFDKLCTIFQGKTIVALALLEGAAFFNLICLLIEHNWWTLVVVGVLVLTMLIEFPTATRMRHWIETQQMRAA